jgi:hypothetical protein
MDKTYLGTVLDCIAFSVFFTRLQLAELIDYVELLLFITNEWAPPSRVKKTIITIQNEVSVREIHHGLCRLLDNRYAKLQQTLSPCVLRRRGFVRMKWW